MSLLVRVLATVCLLSNADAQDEYYSEDGYQYSYPYDVGPEEPDYRQYRSEGFRRILGGNATDITRWPSALKMNIRLQNGDLRHCGGAIISRNWAITAAHCVEGSEPHDIVVRAGSTYMEEGGTVHEIKMFVVHERYEKNRIPPVYDIALLKVSEPFKLTSPNVGAARLPGARDTVPVGSVAIKVGWGYFKTGSTKLSPVLRMVESFVISNRECAKQGLHMMYYNFCTAELCGHLRGTMPGDAGGPVYVDGILYGLHSTGFRDKSTVHADKHVHIPHFREWIARIAGV